MIKIIAIYTSLHLHRALRGSYLDSIYLTLKILTSLRKSCFISPWKWKKVSRCSLSLAKPIFMSVFHSGFRLQHCPVFKLIIPLPFSPDFPTQYTYLDHALPILNLWNSDLFHVRSAYQRPLCESKQIMPKFSLDEVSNKFFQGREAPCNAIVWGSPTKSKFLQW